MDLTSSFPFPEATPVIAHPHQEVQEINRFEDLKELQPVWRRLLDATPGATFFQSYEWLETYWRFYGAGQKLRVLVVSRNGEPSGIVPLTVIGEATRIGRVKVLTYPLHDWGSFYGPIGADPGGALAAALSHIKRSRRDWEMLDLRWVDPRADAGRTPQALLEAGFPALAADWAHSPLVEIEGDWNQYLEGRSPKFRSTLRRYEKKLAALGEVTFLRYRSSDSGGGDPRWDLYDVCVSIAEQSWQGASTTGTTLSHGSVRDYLRATHEAAARFGAVEMNILSLSGRPIGFCYNYFHAGQSFGLRKGSLPEFSSDGAPTVLTARVLEDSFIRGDRLYDMGPGSLDIKERWMTRLATCLRYTHYPLAAPKAQILRLKHWWKKTHHEAHSAT